MAGGSNPRQVATPALNASPATSTPTQAGAVPSPGGMSGVFDQFRSYESRMSPSAMQALGQQAMQGGQQMNTSGPQLIGMPPASGQQPVVGLNPEQWAQKQAQGFQDFMNNPNISPEMKAQAQIDYTAQYGQPTGRTQQGLLGSAGDIVAASPRAVTASTSPKAGQPGRVTSFNSTPANRPLPGPGTDNSQSPPVPRPANAQVALAPGTNRLASLPPAAVQTQPAATTPAAPAQPNIFQQSAGAYTGAINAANAAAAFQPQQVGTSFGYTPDALTAERVGTTFGYTPDTVTAQTAVGGIQQYFNPYEQQVIEASMGDLERQRMRQMAQMGAQATAARAFGGSRQGVAQALTNEAFAQQGGQLASQLRAQGFQTALGASQQDVANQLQAALANQGATARAAEFGQSTTLQAQQANQQAALQAAQANQAARARASEFGQSTGLQAQMANQNAGLSAAGLRAGAAGTLGSLAQQGLNMGQSITAQQGAVGERQRLINQALIDATKGQYGGFTGAPANSLSALLAALGGANMGQNTTTQTQQPGLFNYLALGLGALSDIRLKDDIKPAGEVGGVRFYTWNWNETGKRLADPKQPMFGVIADEVAISHPQYVSRGADGYLRVNYAGLIGELRAA